MDADESQVLRKVYFIKQAAEGEELVTLLKNKFKTIDAIRDVLGWYRDGREFIVDLVGWEASGEPGGAQLRFEITKWTSASDNNRSIIGAIGSILSWLDAERPFDIALIPRQSLEPGPGTVNLN